MSQPILAMLLTAALLPGGGASRTPQVGGSDASATSPSTQSAPALAKARGMNVDIWPEFDDPRVLVIYDGRVPEGAAMPTEVSFVVPADAQIHMAGGIAPGGAHVHAELRSRPRGDGLKEVSYTLEVPRFYMEFYYDPLSDSDQRRFTYPVETGFDVDSLVVRVQEPRRAEEFGVVPLSEDVAQDDRGFDYHVLAFADLEAGSVTPVTVSYRKSDREPSVAAAAPGAADTGPESSPWRRARTWILGALAAAFFVVGFYKLFTDPDSEPERSGVAGRGVGRRRPSGTPSDSRSARPAEAARFCTECGHPAGADHRYCGQCGHPLETIAAGGSRRRR